MVPSQRSDHILCSARMPTASIENGLELFISFVAITCVQAKFRFRSPVGLLSPFVRWIRDPALPRGECQATAHVSSTLMFVPETLTSRAVKYHVLIA